MKKRLSWIELFEIVVGIAAVIFVAIYTVAAIVNACNRITEGKIVDKHYHAAYTTTTHRTTANGDSVTVPKYVPERYIFTIEGEKNGDTVKYTFDVTAEEFHEYSIGDYFRR